MRKDKGYVVSMAAGSERREKRTPVERVWKNRKNGEVK